MNYSSIDIFCHLIDNFGDVGVAYRFAKEFKAARPDCRVRAFFDNTAALHEIAGEIDPGEVIQEHNSVVCVKYPALSGEQAGALGAADVMVEMFACEIPEPFMETAYDNSKLIINLEYLSAEGWVEGYHLKESLLGRGTARKFFFVPGFREGTGGLIINSRLREALAKGALDRPAVIRGILEQYGGANLREAEASAESGLLIGTVFTYGRGFDTFLSDLIGFGRETLLLVFGEKSRSGMSSALGRLGVGTGVTGGGSGKRPYQHYACENIRLLYMPFVNQHVYDTLLCCTDFNIVRGEDSLVRAVLSGKPFIWNAYIQSDNYQHVKVAALLDTLRRYFDDGGVFAAYSDLMMSFNAAPSESSEQTTSERYVPFFENLRAHERAGARIYDFMVNNCDLVSNFCNFLDGYAE